MNTPRVLLRLLNTSKPAFNLVASTSRLYTTSTSSNLNSKKPSSSSSIPIDPHPFLSQINNGTSSSSSSSSSSSNLNNSGPFPLPSSSTREENIRNSNKKWKELKGSEKIGIVANQSWSLIVVLIGAGVASAVIYSTGTELFSNNSPTRIFEDCIERVGNSNELKSILIEPYQFHGQNSSNRLRRNRRISSTLTTNSEGSEILLVRFWIESTPLPTDPSIVDNTTWFDKIKEYVGPVIWEDSTKPGSYVPRPSNPSNVMEEVIEVVEDKSWNSWIMGGVYSIFGGIIPRTSGNNGKDANGKKIGTGSLFTRKNKKTKRGEYTSGEVVAELKKNPTTGNFEYQRLFVDIPDTRAVDRYRVNISTDIVGESTKGLDRIRIWYRNTVSA